jgi:exopolysaccharide biosynthesis polyprenyl glycosylphosphotransferase
MTGDYEPVLAEPRAEPGPRPMLAGSARHDPARHDAARYDPARPAGGRRAGAAVRLLALPVADTAALVAAVVLSRAALGSAVVSGARAGLLCALYVAAVLIVLAAGRQHRLRICLRVSDQVGRILIATIGPVLILLGWLPATHVLALALWSGGLVFTCRQLVCTALRAAHRRGRLTEPAVVVGAGTFGAYVAELMRDHPELGLRPMGLLDDGPPRRDLSVPSLGSPDDLSEVVRRLGIRRVIVCFSSACRDEDVVTVMRAHRPLRADVYVVPRLYELGMAVPRGCLDEIWGIPLIPLRSFGHSAAAAVIKRAFDVVVALMFFAVAAPLMLALAVAIRLRTRQPALFRQTRVTGQGRVAPIMKLRTLAGHADQDTRWTAGPHFSPFGKWLRASHLDELPQLVNVIRGDMSLVGPRPERPFFAERFSREIPRYEGRTRMPAGMTGWAQVNGLNGDTSIFERARFDNYYVEYWSVWLDVVILVRTLAAVVHGGRPVSS